MRSLPVSFYFLVLCTLLIANIFVYRDVFASQILTITIFGVGRGNATLVQTPDYRNILINTGSDASILRALGTTLPLWQRSIDAVVLTSISTKNIGGLSDLLARYSARQIIHADGHDFPYGGRLSIGNTNNISLIVVSKDVFTVSDGVAVLSISSSTPDGFYSSNGETFTKK